MITQILPSVNRDTIVEPDDIDSLLDELLSLAFDCNYRDEISRRLHSFIESTSTMEAE